MPLWDARRLISFSGRLILTIRRAAKVCIAVLGVVLAGAVGAGAATTHTTPARAKAAAKHLKAVPHAVAHSTRLHASTANVATRAAVTTKLVRGPHGKLVRVAVRHRFVERFTGNSFSDDVTAGDVADGEDPVVRAAAVEALGNMNGTALAIDPATGRILAMVNQKLALASGAEPCSTIKLSVALAALQEGIITRTTPVALGGGYHLNLTEALAHSNNLYFETLGRTLGFERVKHYANQLGLGELAGYNIPGSSWGRIRMKSCRRRWVVWAGCARLAKA